MKRNLKVLDINQSKVIAFRNKSLAKISKQTYGNVVKEFNSYLIKNNLKTNAETIEKFLQTIKTKNKSATYNLKRQGLKEYLCERYKNNHPQLAFVEGELDGDKDGKQQEATSDNSSAKSQTDNPADASSSSRSNTDDKSSDNTDNGSPNSQKTSPDIKSEQTEETHKENLNSAKPRFLSWDLSTLKEIRKNYFTRI